MNGTRRAVALTASAMLLLAACQPTASPDESTEGSPTGEAATVQLQLQWAQQAQFAGYYAAAEQGYYADENLTVEFLPGGGDVVPQQVGSAPDGPEFTIAWVPKVLQAREAGSDLVQIAQVFQRSATLAGRGQHRAETPGLGGKDRRLAIRNGSSLATATGRMTAERIHAVEQDFA